LKIFSRFVPVEIVTALSAANATADLLMIAISAVILPPPRSGGLTCNLGAALFRQFFRSRSTASQAAHPPKSRHRTFVRILRCILRVAGGDINDQFGQLGRIAGALRMLWHGRIVAR
jgi:hypothetical protein